MVKLIDVNLPRIAPWEFTFKKRKKETKAII